MSHLTKTNIYTLLLRDKKYYVGKAEDVDVRFDLHLAGRGAAWTKLHKPIRIESVLRDASPFDEDRVVKELMLKHGIENVRGGSYSQIVLTDDQIRTIQTEIWGALDKCIKCGRSGHFVAHCFTPGESKDIEAAHRELAADIIRASMTETATLLEQKKCARCGRASHDAGRCYAMYDSRGGRIKK